jgi:hypothetical protein
MLEVCTDLSNHEFAKRFTIDLSRVPSDELITHCELALQHHSSGSIFLGFLEPGWMLSPEHQTRMRPVFRTLDVGFVCYHLESVPYSWKENLALRSRSKSRGLM